MGILSKIMYVYDSMLAAYEPEPAKKKLTELLGARGTPKYVDELCDWLGSYIAVNAGVAHVKVSLCLQTNQSFVDKTSRCTISVLC